MLSQSTPIRPAEVQEAAKPEAPAPEGEVREVEVQGVPRQEVQEARRETTVQVGEAEGRAHQGPEVWKVPGFVYRGVEAPQSRRPGKATAPPPKDKGG